MLQTPPTGTRAPSDTGFIDHLRSFGATGLDYLSARLELAGIESKEASSHYLKIVALAFVGLCAVLFGYIFLVAAAVAIIAYVFSVQWMWVLLGCGVLHILGAALCFWIATNRIAAPMFTATLNEFKKDRKWLSNQKPS